MGQIPGSEGLGNAVAQPRSIDLPQIRTGDRGAIGRLGQLGIDAAAKIKKNNDEIAVAGQVTSTRQKIVEYVNGLDRDEDFSTQEARYEELVGGLTKEAERSLGNQELVNQYRRSIDDYVFNQGVRVKSNARTGQLKVNQNNANNVLNSHASLVSDALIKGDSALSDSLVTEANEFIVAAIETGTFTPSEGEKAKKNFTREVSSAKINRDLQTSPETVIKRLEEGGYNGIEGADRVMYAGRAQSKIEQKKKKQEAERKQLSTEYTKDIILALDNGHPVTGEELQAGVLAAQDAKMTEDFANAVAASQFMLMPKSARDATAKQKT